MSSLDDSSRRNECSGHALADNTYIMLMNSELLASGVAKKDQDLSRRTLLSGRGVRGFLRYDHLYFQEGRIFGMPWSSPAGRKGQVGRSVLG